MSSVKLGSVRLEGHLTMLASARNWAAVTAAFVMPWTTTGEAIAVGIWVVLALLTIRRDTWSSTLSKPAAAIPALLFLVILAGMLWSPEPFGAGGVTHYLKLLLIPIAMACSTTPRQALRIGYGLLAGCSVILILSWAGILWPSGPWGWFKSPGVPVKDNAVQSTFFALSAFGLAIGAISQWSSGRRRLATAMVALAMLFLLDIFLIFVSKTGLLVAGSLLALFLLHVGGWRRALLLALPVAIAVTAAIWFSASAQIRLGQFLSDMQAVKSSSETISTAARLDFWSKAVSFIKTAPVLGHGTGSIKSLYQSLEATRPSPYGEATSDPHNQFFAIAIQVGLVGGGLLLAMWAAHFAMFVGRGFAGALGQAVVLQNVVGSLFNSHLSTITQGTLYCLAVGIIGAVIANSSDWSNVSAFDASEVSSR